MCVRRVNKIRFRENLFFYVSENIEHADREGRGRRRSIKTKSQSFQSLSFFCTSNLILIRLIQKKKR